MSGCAYSYICTRKVSVIKRCKVKNFCCNKLICAYRVGSLCIVLSYIISIWYPVRIKNRISFGNNFCPGKIIFFVYDIIPALNSVMITRRSFPLIRKNKLSAFNSGISCVIRTVISINSAAGSVKPNINNRAAGFDSEVINRRFGKILSWNKG